MKTLLIVLSLLFFTCGPVMASEWRNLNTFVEHSGFDTMLHVEAGA